MLLRKMRKKVKVIMWTTLILIVPAFVLWGIGMRSSSKKNIVAKVDGSPITLDQFYQAYNYLYNHYALLFSQLEQEEFEEKIEVLNIEEQAFDLLVNNILIGKEIKKRHIKVSDEEVAEAMKKLPFFRTPGGKFDKTEFERKIQNVPLSQWQILEKQIRSKVALEKLREKIESQCPSDGDKEVFYTMWLAELKSQAKIKKRELPRLTE